jgi:hypothetical protein
LTYGELMRDVAELLPGQSPTIGVFGRADASAAKAPAFGLKTAEPGPRDARKADFGKIHTSDSTK